jgi:cytochrome P450
LRIRIVAIPIPWVGLGAVLLVGAQLGREGAVVADQLSEQQPRWSFAMLTQPTPIVPPAPKVHAKELPVWQMLLLFTRDTISAMSEDAFDALISRRRVLGIDSFLVSDPDGVRHVLATAMGKYQRLVATRRVLGPFGRSGVFLAEGAEWRRQHRIVAPVFTPASVEKLLPHFLAAATGLVRRLEGMPHANLSLAFQEATLEAVLRALFSMPISAQGEHIAAMVRSYFAGPGRPTIVDGFAPTEQSFPLLLGRRRRFQQAWSAAVDEVIASRRSAPAARSRDLLDLLLTTRDSETGGALSDGEVRDQCGTMLVAGYETTARLLFWTAYLLTLDTAEQARLRAEVRSFPPERVARLDDLDHWPRLRQTLLESLRLYPPVAHIAREAIADDVIAGEPVRPGAQVWISPWVIHRHRKFWEHPTAFMPNRFEGKPSPWSSGGTFLPFGTGPRICIGATFALAEAQIMLAALLSRFAITLTDRRPVLPAATVTMAPSYEPRFILEPT